MAQNVISRAQKEWPEYVEVMVEPAIVEEEPVGEVPSETGLETTFAHPVPASPVPMADCEVTVAEPVSLNSQRTPDTRENQPEFPNKMAQNVISRTEKEWPEYVEVKVEPAIVEEETVIVWEGPDDGVTSETGSPMTDTYVELEVDDVTEKVDDRLRCYIEEPERAAPIQSGECTWMVEKLAGRRDDTKDEVEKITDLANRNSTAASRPLQKNTFLNPKKPYACYECSYSSSRKSDLMIHLRRHTGEKPYKCDVCDYKCSQAGRLNLHKRTHSGGKPYKCDSCRSRFTTASDLQKHTGIHALKILKK